jgi:hypothetical protein
MPELERSDEVHDAVADAAEEHDRDRSREQGLAAHAGCDLAQGLVAVAHTAPGIAERQRADDDGHQHPRDREDRPASHPVGQQAREHRPHRRADAGDGDDHGQRPVA